jgi:hypothetical protein
MIPLLSIAIFDMDGGMLRINIDMISSGKIAFCISRIRLLSDKFTPKYPKNSPSLASIIIPLVVPSLMIYTFFCRSATTFCGTNGVPIPNNGVSGLSYL